MDYAPTVSVPVGDVLIVSADAGSYGTVFQVPGSAQWTVSAKSPLHLGPGVYRIETVKGQVQHRIESQAVAALAATLPRATDIVAIHASLIGPVMLKNKFARLAERAKAVPAALGDRADKALARLDAVEARGVVFDHLDAIATDAEQSVAAAEDAVNQLTNGNSQ